MRKMSVVILNYKNYQDTIECVDSLLKQNGFNYLFEIIIVDNCSENFSVKILTDKYKLINQIHILKSNKNEGYAKGNNRGILYSLKVLKIDKVLVLNNDTIMVDNNYLLYLYNFDYRANNLGAIGTKIIGEDGINQNPVYTSISFKRIILDLSLSLLIYTNIFPVLRVIYRSMFKPLLTKIHMANSNLNVNNNNQFYILHGSSILLTPLFFKYFNGLYPKTFLYYEENILALMMMKVNLNWKYTNEIGVYHKEDRSSNLVFEKPLKSKHKYLIFSTIQAIRLKLSNIKKIRRLVNSYSDITNSN